MVGTEDPPGNGPMDIVAAGPASSAVPDLRKLKISTVESHTKAVGIIVPPPDIRAILEKTAQFVAKNGVAFEQKILANEEKNNKFQFLIPTNPYHTFYRKKVEDFKEGGGEAAEGKAAAPAKEPEPEPEVVKVIRTKDLEKPDPEKYTVHVPEGLSAMDIDVIKLTSQFVARNGRSFLQDLSAKETKNPLFSFLRPTHSLHGFFTALADAYARVLMPPKSVIARLEADMADRTKIMERCLKRLEYDKALDRERQEAAEEQERERSEMQQIDWHDFVVVETIDFFDDEDLPPPLTLQDLLTLRKAQEVGEAEAAAEKPREVAGAGAGVRMDAEEAAMVREASGAGRSAGVTGGTGGVVVVDDAAPLRVVRDYQREIRGRGMDPTQYVVSPLTGEIVAVRDMEEHMRVSLIDPRWRQQKEAMLSKLRDTTRANDEEITSNLMTLAKTRPDIFATTEEELQGVLANAIEERKTTGTGRPVAWDGFTKGKGAAEQQRQAEEQRAGGQVKAFPRVQNPPLPQQGPQGESGEQPTKRQRTE